MLNQSFRNVIKKFIQQSGYELHLNKIAKKPYEERGVAFIHIAKCGGISIDSALREVFATAGQPRINRNSAIETSLLNFTQDQPSPENSARFGDLHVKTIQTLINYHLGLNWSYVSGHTAVTLESLTQYHNKYHFVTVLREPIKRFISHYIFTKLTNTLPIMLPNKFDVDNIIDEAKGIISSRRGWHMANTPTMCLTGRYPSDREEALLMQPKVLENLRYFSVVGFLDDLASFSSQISIITKKEISIKHRNATNNLLDENKVRIEQILQEFFEERTTQLTLAHLCKFETENFLKAQEIYVK